MNLRFLFFFTTTNLVKCQNSLSESSWSCGVFIIDSEGLLEPPLGQYYELPAQQTECPAKFKDTWKRGKFAKKCGRLGSEWESNWIQQATASGRSWELNWTPLVSILSTGKYTKDVCTIVKQELGIENIPSEDIPDPLQFGYYYTFCGKDEWKDTGVKSDVLICCQNGVAVDCDSIDTSTLGEEDADTSDDDNAVNVGRDVTSLSASPSDSDSGAGLPGYGEGGSGGPGGLQVPRGDAEVQNKINQMRLVATLLLEKAKELESTL